MKAKNQRLKKVQKQVFEQDRQNLSRIKVSKAFGLFLNYFTVLKFVYFFKKIKIKDTAKRFQFLLGHSGK